MGYGEPIELRLRASAMNDIEITRLCAEAMGYDEYSEHIDAEGRWEIYLERDAGIGTRIYWPLNDDAQAMALVKKFGLHLGREDIGDWIVEMFSWKRGLWMEVAHSKNLNRAICECVAKMQVAKK